MQIEYKTKKLEKICTNFTEAEKKHGHKMALKIHQRIDDIAAMPTVETMIQYKIGNEIQIANIMEIVDYHN